MIVKNMKSYCLAPFYAREKAIGGERQLLGDAADGEAVPLIIVILRVEVA